MCTTSKNHEDGDVANCANLNSSLVPLLTTDRKSNTKYRKCLIIVKSVFQKLTKVKKQVFIKIKKCAEVLCNIDLFLC